MAPAKYPGARASASRAWQCGLINLRGMNQMNTLIKAAIAGALSLGATGAFAATGQPWSNSSDLILVVENASTHAAYALDTGITLNSVLPTGSLVSNATLNTSLAGINDAISASPALQSFLAANPAAGDAWTLEGGQWNGGGSASATNSNTKAPGAAKAVFTSDNGTVNNTNVTTKTLGNMQSFLNGLNTDIIAGGGLNGLESASETSSATGSLSADARYGFWTNMDFSSLGSAAIQLFGFSGNNTTGKLQSYILGTATLDANGNLTIKGSATPLPAAVWLLGSGLLGLFGVSRRRATAV